MNGNAVDGLVFVSAVLDSPLPGRRRARIPLVLLNRDSSRSTSTAWSRTTTAGGRLVAERAPRARPSRGSALIAGPQNTSTSRDREAGFRERLAEAGLPLDENLRRGRPVQPPQRLPVVPRPARGRPAPDGGLRRQRRVAFGALDAARRVGVRVPDELSIIGYDDIDMAGWEVFSLTTMRQPLTEMARAAALLLMERHRRPTTRSPRAAACSPSGSCAGTPWRRCQRPDLSLAGASHP